MQKLKFTVSMMYRQKENTLIALRRNIKIVFESRYMYTILDF